MLLELAANIFLVVGQGIGSKREKLIAVDVVTDEVDLIFGVSEKEPKKVVLTDVLKLSDILNLNLGVVQEREKLKHVIDEKDHQLKKRSDQNEILRSIGQITRLIPNLMACRSTFPVYALLLK